MMTKKYRKGVTMLRVEWRLAYGNKGASQVYSVGSKAQRERSPLSEEIGLDLRNSPGSNNMEEGCFGSKYLRGFLENYDISVGSKQITRLVYNWEEN